MTLEEQKVFIDFGWSPILNSQAQIVGWTHDGPLSEDAAKIMCARLGVGMKRLRDLDSVDKSELLLCELS
jgi:hypothetical protein